MFVNILHICRRIRTKTCTRAAGCTCDGLRATGRCGVVTLTAPVCFSVYIVRILIVLISINSTHTCTLGMGLSVWQLCRRLWRRRLYLWQPAVPPVDAESSLWQHLSVLVFISNEYWSSLFRLILLIYMYTGDGAVGVTIMSSFVATRVVLLTACGATGRLVDVGSSHWQLLPVLMLVSHKYRCWVFDKYTRIDILAHWPWDQTADIFNKFLHIAGCSLESKLKNVSVV